VIRISKEIQEALREGRGVVALETTLVAGKTLTRDLGGKAGTDEFADAVIAAL